VSGRKTELPGLVVQAPAAPPALVLVEPALLRRAWVPPPAIPLWELAAEYHETIAKSVVTPRRICSCPGFDAAELAAASAGRAGLHRERGANGAP
jgi:hypothetical protein